MRLEQLEQARELSSAERQLQRTAFDGLEEAGHFGLPVMAIAAGAAPARWTPAVAEPAPAPAPASASEPRPGSSSSRSTT